MKKITILLLLVFGATLFSVAGSLPRWGDPNSPAATHVGAYYLENSYKDTATPNVVTSVLGDYRGFDTMLEATVVLIAGLAVMLLLRMPMEDRAREVDEILKRKTTEDASLVVRTTSRILLPPMQLFALYVIAHGHHSPGGGFQGGVILGATFIMYEMAFDIKTALQRFSEMAQLFYAFLGVAIFCGLGVLCISFGGEFLNYGAIGSYFDLPIDRMRSLAVLGVEIGVAFTVMAVMFSIYNDLASGGKFERGL